MTTSTLPLTPPRSLSPSSSSDDGSHFKAARKGRRTKFRSVFMRAGTSKGLFLRLADLPEDREAWGPLLLAAMGSPDPGCRQLNGMGGGSSTQSKVAVMSVSPCPEADVDYLFIQVPVDGSPLDFTGNCGNMLAGVGPFSVEEKLFAVKSKRRHAVSVRIRNVNTGKIVRSTFDVEDGVPVELGEMCLDGVSAPGAPIRLDFLNPAGAMTGKLLPTGQAIDIISLPSFQSSGTPREYRVSCVDAANPFVFVSAEELGLIGGESLAVLAETVTSTLMEIRCQAAILMGLASTVEMAALTMGTPKIAIIGPPSRYETPAGRVINVDEADLWIRPYSMGNPHPTIQMTGAVCVGAASSVPGTLVNWYFAKTRKIRGDDLAGPLIVGHAGGTMAVEGTCSTHNGKVHVECGTVYRTARRLMEGTVMCYV